MDSSSSLWRELDTKSGEQIRVALLAFIRSHTRSADIADDVFQETLIRTNTSGAQTRLQNPLAYMITVAKSVIYDINRKMPLHTSEWQDETPAANDCPEDTYLNQKKLECIESILQEMSELRRTVFLLRRVDGLSREEIATKQGLSVEAVKKHLTRAMVEITLKLEDAGWTHSTQGK